MLRFYTRFNKVVIAAIVVALLFASVIVIEQASAQIASVRQVLTERENVLANLVTKAESEEAQRCSRLSTWSNSDVCNRPSCGNVFPTSEGFACTGAYGSDHDTCGSHCDNLIRSVNKSTVLFAPDSSFTNKDIQGFMSYGSQWEGQAQRERDRQRAWMGIGHYSGASRWFPGSPRKRSNKCQDYDPRLRSWYVAASSGPKDVVLVLDVSGSMSGLDGTRTSRLTLLKSATKALLNTLTLNDFFAIVKFSDSASVITSGTTLRQATYANIASAKRSVDALFASGGTYFKPAFQKAFDTFATSTETNSNCQRMILFLTDGVAEDSGSIVSDIQTMKAASAFSTRKPAIMTFSMTSVADDVKPKAIACDNQGIWHRVQTGKNPLDQMSQYYKLLAFNIDSNKSRWVEFYQDAFGMGRMTTASRPVYDRSGSSPVFIGVAEVDVPLGELTKFASEADVLGELRTRGGVCPSVTIADCELQRLRAEAGYECPGITSYGNCQGSTAVAEVATCPSGVTGGLNAMLCETLNTATQLPTSGGVPYDEVACCDCGLSPGAIAGIVIGSLVGVALIGGGLYMVFSGGGAAAGAAGSSAVGGGSAAAGASAAPAPAAAPAASYPPQPGQGGYHQGYQHQQHGGYGQQQPSVPHQGYGAPNQPGPYPPAYGQGGAPGYSAGGNPYPMHAYPQAGPGGPPPLYGGGA